ncbi:MAG: ABC transporter ATP-binding protein [Chloroflexi bacterium RBG_13_51_18]|nr:MAG: ABC transporter ATP-binding protein [Chloroflexi bacterium RBG_13_51_18]
MHLLEGKGVSIHFGGLAAVSDVDFYVDEGEIVGLIGPNGAGKTTLFNLISAALEPKPGEILLKGKRINGLKPYQICRLGIARTFQTVKIFGSLPAIENVRIGSLFGPLNRLSTMEATKEAIELLEFVGLSDVASAPAKDLTLSSQKRLEVARALATRPALLLLDEIMAGLNQTELLEAMELVKKIQKRGVTVVMIEHVMKAIMGICDRIIVLHHGKKIGDGTPQEVANSKTVIEVYLGEASDAGD